MARRTKPPTKKKPVALSLVGRKHKLTFYQKRLRKEYVRVDKQKISLVVRRKGVHQEFRIDVQPEDKAHAGWFADMLAIALSNLLKEEMGSVSEG